MKMWNLGKEAIDSLQQLPETGMGFQIVTGVCLGKLTPLLIFNSEFAIDLSNFEFEVGDDPSVILRNGLRVVDALKGSTETLFSAPQPHSFELINSRIDPLFIGKSTSRLSPKTAMPSSLIKSITLNANRKFYRFSAFNPDRRVDPNTGDFFPGTYATVESELPFAPTGFSAVGRFALPNNLPASNRYTIVAGAGTQVSFGTVAPAYGQSGGGVEAYFQKAVKNQKIPPDPPVNLPDE